MKIKLAIYGFGNIGKYALEAIANAPDAECIGVIRRPSSLGKNIHELQGIPDFADLESLIAKQTKPDVILLSCPSREVPSLAPKILAQGISTVDSFDIHDRILEVLQDLQNAAKNGSSVAITAAGWDPGTDSILRTLFEAMIPIGTSFTNFGRGRSMGHSVAARAIKGVKDACSITIPLGAGRHSRLVYIVLEPQADLETVKKLIATDPYFSHDPLEIRAVTQDELKYVADASHGVLLERTGGSGFTSNQQLKFDMRIDNPALTAQVMLASARAAKRLSDLKHYGAKTLIDIPPVMLLSGDRFSNIARLV